MAEQPRWQELKKIPLFSALTEQEIYQVMKLSFEKKYTKDSTLFIEGMPGEVLYIVKAGKVDILKKTPQGEVLLSHLGPGEFLGEMSLIDDIPRSATARVAEDSELVVITRKCFQDMLKGDPHISAQLLMHFLKVASSRLRATDKRLELN
ncbi:MAG TPA: cyclic nucleotide-binding domain-containing protein [bacterium]|jgi:CRP/FNR family cyclic AMP-dependent transcriptional regulator|nr:cyclic nucleotide-binding domain-containing protein [bacterium]